MLDDNRITLIKFRLEQAHECLDSARREINAEAYKSAANRAYYAIFHAMRAVLAKDKFDSKKHSGIIAVFRQNYIKTGIFQAELSNIIRDAFDTRSNSDYEDFFVITKEETAEQIANAEEFLSAIESYLTAYTEVKE